MNEYDWTDFRVEWDEKQIEPPTSEWPQNSNRRCKKCDWVGTIVIGEKCGGCGKMTFGAMWFTFPEDVTGPLVKPWEPSATPEQIEAALSKIKELIK